MKTSLRVSIGGTKIKDKMVLPLNETQQKPVVTFDKFSSNKYTYVMVDPDAPTKSDAKFKYWLHWLVINNNEEVVPFIPPSPPAKSGPHRYFIFLYKQKHGLDKNNLGIPNEVKENRKNFKLGDFMADNDLEDVGSVYFLTENK
ncbi:MAG: hypothetical protein Satyrvirus1_65 [Satyrvirus sp.]|uniref:Phosphatidylethanolamine-binding protein-like protein n=1 Tax=Satyrvirus sp. TaxID=2487771 RepID=A0A3G5AHU2_9VIRU|nr:MAG: hypothetical protein Satyrvirus1_65 [Satyrvirus sp.]